ncbi:DUF2461 domain-containing protein [Pontibacter sp. 172403-2]|uniref:DUF2461 domain-containing protein n=1 Tax=Pontibacter rufus TaxID=2791028 RepID=UPI0018AFDF66|nr:DUF2461 domain-containing protein [Pontibacter sp. 172403-2]MBF9253965.1 DUF2461 domain-containing protein [Pontibacter sp. 172403-2]
MNITFVLNFLRELQQNNSKAWMDAHRSEYLQAKSFFREFVEQLLAQLKTIDPALHATTANDSIFRINKNDFSKKGEAPYKGHFAAGISPGGRHSAFANYVFVLEPGNKSRVGGGIRQPAPALLALLRQEIDYSPGELEAILAAPAFKSQFGTLQGQQRKSAPKGYAKSHPAIALLRYNGFQALHFFTDEEVQQPDFIYQLLPLYRQLMPLHHFLNRVITNEA